MWPWTHGPRKKKTRLWVVFSEGFIKRHRVSAHY
jgi:hypothetical protein